MPTLDKPLDIWKIIALGVLVHIPIPLIFFPGKGDSIFPSIGEVLFFSTAIASWIICLVHAAKNTHLSGSRKQALWIILIILFAPLGSIGYFWFQVLPNHLRIRNAE